MTKLIPTWVDTGEGSEFGRSVDVDGDTMVVGAIDDEEGDGAGAVFIYQRDAGGPNVWGQVAKLTADDGSSGDDFGISVSISGDTVLVGAWFEDAASTNSGSAYIFERDQGGADSWGQVTKLVASDGGLAALFGCSVSISGDIAVVGAPFDDNNGHSDSGAAYIFYRNLGGADAWGQVKKLQAWIGADIEYFGNSVSVDGDTAVIGVPNDSSDGSYSGSAYVFGRDEGGPDGWGILAKITASDAASYDEFGLSVAISSDILVVGSRYDNSHTGSAYVFSRNVGGQDVWGEVAKLTAADGSNADEFGVSVSIHGDTVGVGAWGEDHGGVNAGSAYIFSRNHGGPDAWGQVTEITASEGAGGDYFGYALSIDGDTAVVGAFADDDNGEDSGSVYVCDRNQGGSNAWGEIATRVAPGYISAVGDNFGFQTAVSGDLIVVGAQYDDDSGYDTGSAYVFARDSGGADTWGQVAHLMPPDGDRVWFGRSVSIAGDTVIVGAYGDDDNGTNSGAAYIFSQDYGGLGAWGLVAKLLPSDPAANDRFGISVSISGDTAVVGSYFDDDNGEDSGSAYVFCRDQGADAWEEVAKITAADGLSGDGFGVAISISGETIIVGSPGDDHAAGNSGSAYVFERNEGGPDAWGQVAKLVVSDPQVWDWFGGSVSIDGDTAVVGAEQFYPGIGPGAAYIFGRNHGGENAWGEVVEIVPSDLETGDEFGASVSISGDIAVVGAPNHDINDGELVYIFERNAGGGDAWGLYGTVIASDTEVYDGFGWALAINDDTIIVGAPDDDPVDYNSGSAYIFDLGRFVFSDGFETGETSLWSVVQP